MQNGDREYRDKESELEAWVNEYESEESPQNEGDVAQEDAVPDESDLILPAVAGSDDTVTPPRAAGSSSPNEEYKFRGASPRQKKSSSGVAKTIALTLFVIVMIVASAVTFMEEPTEDNVSIGDPAARAPYEFFAPPAETTTPDFSEGIPHAPLVSGVVLDIHPVPDGSELSRQEVYAKCNPWVVAISADAPKGGSYWGSGILITRDGYIVTNNHIIEGTVSVTVILHDDSEYEALLVGADSRSDLAVLKIDANDLPFAQFGDSAVLLTGDDVVAIGNPLGRDFRSTITDGIISSISRDIHYENFKMNVLQTTAAVNEGNSGGPLINMYGQVIGITNMKMVSYDVSIEGIAFAIPSNSIKTVVDELVELGYVSGRPAIGITPGSIPLTAKDFYSLPEGLYVKSVNINSDAYTKGIRPGDIIVAADGEPVSTPLDLNSIKDLFAVGDTLTLTVFRDGETFDVDVVLCDMVDLDD